MVASFRAYMESGGQDPDHRLGQILREHRCDVTRRDWYVAVSVIQWLATNIGSTVLEGAGYKYTKLDEDRELREARLPTTLMPPPPVEP